MDRHMILIAALTDENMLPTTKVTATDPDKQRRRCHAKFPILQLIPDANAYLA